MGRRWISALGAAKETDWGAPSLIFCRFLYAGIHHLIPPGIHSSVALPAHLSTMRLRSEVSAEPLWVALRSGWMLVRMPVAGL